MTWNPSEELIDRLFDDVKSFRHQRLGEMAVDRGMLTADDLGLCLREQQKSGAALGRILVERKLIDEDALQRLLQEQVRQDLSPFLAAHSPGVPEEVRQADPNRTFDKYIRVSLIGQGAMGKIWKAWDRDLNRWVALKILKEAGSETHRTRFLREAQAAAALQHPNLITVFDAGVVEGQQYLAMELIKGAPLNLQGNRDAALRALVKIARALDVAHQKGIVHRDLKPANILIDESGEPFVVDFGLAHLVDSGKQMTQEGTAIGTPQYMAPEQVRGLPEEIGPGTDTYALGAMLYELLTGWPPHSSGSMVELFHKIVTEDVKEPTGPRDLAIICTKALQKNPDRRYASAAEFANDLERYLRGEAISARPSSFVYKTRKALGRRRAVVIASLILVLTGVVVGVWLIPSWRRAVAERERKEEELRKERDRREAEERARPHIDDGRRSLADMLAKMREPEYTADELGRILDKAVAAFQRAIAEVPNHSGALLGMGRGYLLAKRHRIALEHLDLCVRSSPEFAPAYFERARVRLQLLSDPHLHEGEPIQEKIESDLNAFERLSTDEPKREYGRGLLAHFAGKHEEARERLSRYLEEESEDGLARFWLGMSYFRSKLWADAERELGLAIIWDSRNLSAWYFRGRMRERLGRADEAIEDYSQAIRVEPRAPLPRLRRADLLMNRNELDKAKQDLAVAIRHSPKPAEAYFHRATIHVHQNNPSAALQDLHQCIRLSPDNATAYLNRGILYARGRRYEDAAADFTRVLQLGPDHPEGLFMRGKCRVELDQLADARTDFERLMTLLPKDAPRRKVVEDYLAGIRRRLGDQ